MPVCPLCSDRFFNDDSALQAHQEAKHRSCARCNKVLKTQQALEQHIRDKHSSFECRYCDREFATENGRDAHENAKHNFECHYCDRTFNSDEAREQHENAKHLFQCHHCDRNFKSEDARQQHEDTKHSFQCRHCVCVFFSENARQQHEDDEHSFQCNYCDRYFDSEEACQQHEDAKHSAFGCHYCDREFTSEEAREQHEAAKHTSFGCHYCDREFSSEGARQQHETAKHQHHCECGVCKRSFAQAADAWQHEAAKHHCECGVCKRSFAQVEAEAPSQPKRTTPHFECAHCGTIHSTSVLKTSHEASCAYNPANPITRPIQTPSNQSALSSSSDPRSAKITAEGTLPSTITNVESQTSASPSHSSQDEEVFHSTSTLPLRVAIGGEVAVQLPRVCAHSLDPVRCLSCQSSNTSKREKDDADSIVSITRTDENQQDDSMDCSDVIFRCTPCLELFETERALRNHVCAFRETMLRPHCPVCYTQFDDGQSLQDHIEGLEAFSCQLCLTRCCSEEMLQDHLLSHPTCSKCGESFADDMTLCTHVEAEHPVVVCWDCGGIVVEKNSLELHYADCSTHPSCTLCGVGMRNSVEMDEHVRQVHVTETEMKEQPGGGKINATLDGSAVPPPVTNRPDEAEQLPAEGVESMDTEPGGGPLCPPQTTPYVSSPLFVPPRVELVDGVAGNTSVTNDKEAPEVERRFASPSPTHPEHGSDASRPFRASKATDTATNNDTRPPSPVSSVSAGSLSDLSTRSSPSSASESVVFVSAEGIPDYVRENRAILVATSAGSPSSSSSSTPLRLSSESSLASLAREAGLGPVAGSRTGEATACGLHCRICLRDPCEDPTATICGHLFCKRCITQAVVAKSECPTCGSATLLYCLFKLDLSV